MAIAALAISVVALIVAAASAFYARKQADATKEQANAATRMARNDAERRLEERRPSFAGEIEPMNDGGWHRLWLRSTSKEALSSVDVEIAEGYGVQFTSGQHGVDPAERPPVLHARVEDEKGRPRPLGPNDRAAWRVQLPDSRPPRIRLNVSAAAGEEAWTAVSVVVDVPPDLLFSVW